MAWRRPGDKPLSEPMMVSLPMHICVTRPQWVNVKAICIFTILHYRFDKTFEKWMTTPWLYQYTHYVSKGFASFHYIISYTRGFHTRQHNAWPPTKVFWIEYWIFWTGERRFFPCDKILKGTFSVWSSRGPFYKLGLTLIAAWISNYIYFKMWGYITYPFRIFSSAAVDVLYWISNLIPHFTGYMMSYPCWD